MTQGKRIEKAARTLVKKLREIDGTYPDPRYGYELDELEDVLGDVLQLEKKDEFPVVGDVKIVGDDHSEEPLPFDG